MIKEELKYAQNYPFSEISKGVVQDANFSLEDIPEAVMLRAEAMLVAVANSKNYTVEIHSSSELMRNEVLAFPVVKILLSCIAKEQLYSRFASFVSKNTFSSLLREDTGRVQELASEFGINFKLSNKEGSFAEIPLLHFLNASFIHDYMKLVNLPVSAGTVFLSRNEFCRYVSEIVYEKIFTSLPVDISSVPKSIKDYAKELSGRVSQYQKRTMLAITVGKVKSEFFPPCMSELYSQLAEGKNINHSARFYLAAFLAAAGMQSEQIISLFKNTPNFKEHITKYQVERIAGKSGKAYSPASCTKIRSAGLCVARCPVKNPIQFYKNKIFDGNKKEVKKNAARNIS